MVCMRVVRPGRCSLAPAMKVHIMNALRYVLAHTKQLPPANTVKMPKCASAKTRSTVLYSVVKSVTVTVTVTVVVTTAEDVDQFFN